ncbi:MAG: hypothetical protein ACXVIG_04450 [Halobacteriota archaeon]
MAHIFCVARYTPTREVSHDCHVINVWGVSETEISAESTYRRSRALHVLLSGHGLGRGMIRRSYVPEGVAKMTSAFTLNGT